MYTQFHSRIAEHTITTLFHGVVVSFVAKPHKLIFEQCDRDRHKFHTSCEIATCKLSVISVGLSNYFNFWEYPYFSESSLWHLSYVTVYGVSLNVSTVLLNSMCAYNTGLKIDGSLWTTAVPPNIVEKKLVVLIVDLYYVL